MKRDACWHIVCCIFILYTSCYMRSMRGSILIWMWIEFILFDVYLVLKVSPLSTFLCIVRIMLMMMIIILIAKHIFEYRWFGIFWHLSKDKGNWFLLEDLTLKMNFKVRCWWNLITIGSPPCSWFMSQWFG